MMKPRYIELVSKEVIISNIVSGILFIGMIILIANDVTAFMNDKLILVICTIAIALMTIGCFLVFIITGAMLLLGICYNYIAKKEYLKSCKKIQKLSNEFSEVYLKDFEEQGISKIIPQEEIKCMAKLSENGDVIYNIYVNQKVSTDDYVKFLKYFDI